MMSIGLMVGEVPEVDPKNRDRAEKHWMYGATAKELAEAWDKPVKVAELKTCGNCQYFDNRARTLKSLKAKAGLGACTKFNFLCSQEKSCQAWDTTDIEIKEED